MNEEKFLQALSDQFSLKSSSQVGPGDDCALVNAPSGQYIVTTDTFVEGVHFPAWTLPADLIKRTLAASLSDINATGGKGSALFVALGVPAAAYGDLEKYASALEKATGVYDLPLMGGDTASSSLRFITMTLTGRLPSALPPLLRSGAEPGDRIYLSGEIGGSAAGLGLVASGWRKVDGAWCFEEKKPDRETKEALDLFLTPEIPYPLGWELHSAGLLSAAIDISDGLALDLTRICRASGVGATVNVECIPIHAGAKRLSPDEVISSGEEFQLLFTSSRILSYPCIGEIERGSEVLFLENGVHLPIHSPGFDHFP